MGCKHGFPRPSEMTWMGDAPPVCTSCRIERLEEEVLRLREQLKEPAEKDPIEEALKFLDEYAESIKKGCTLPPEWEDFSYPEDEIWYNRVKHAANDLRMYAEENGKKYEN